MSDTSSKPVASESGLDSAEPSEYETFKTGLRQILSVPKSEIDRREADWQKAQEQKPTRKKKAA